MSNDRQREDTTRNPAEPESPDELAKAPRQMNDTESSGERHASKGTLETVTGARDDILTERDDLVHRLQRVAADYLNYQKRVQKELLSMRAFANEDLIKALLPVLDDMDHALETGMAMLYSEDPFLVGLRLVQEKLMAVLGRFGLTAIESLDKPFDPNCHCAVATDNSGHRPPNVVVRELRRGYALKGRIVRPTLVVVSVASNDLIS